MNMFCYQCQETGSGKGCTSAGICGKTDETANLQDLLIYMLQGMSFYASKIFIAGGGGKLLRPTGELATECLFTTVTNTNFDPDRIKKYILRVIAQRDALKEEYLKAGFSAEKLPDNAVWTPKDDAEIYRKSMTVGVLEERDPKIRSVKETITYGLKGLSAYTYHASVLGYYNDGIYLFIFSALRKVDADTPMNELLELTLGTGKCNLDAMELLDRANYETYGAPVPVKVSTSPGNRPGILVTGHELKDLEMLLKQSEGSGVDIYTNGEMILAQSLPFFRKFKHLAGNYGNAWWQQDSEFASFNGPILVTSNCIIPVEDAYRDRIFTTSVAGYPGVPHFEPLSEQESVQSLQENEGRNPALRENGGKIISGGGIEHNKIKKDFSQMIDLAKKLPPPSPLNEPDFMTGYRHQYLHEIKDKIIDLVKRGKIKKFVLMGGCDGRDPKRRYYKEKAVSLTRDAVILTSGCAKYRYIKQVKGEIEGIPRVLDAGQCSDNYSFIAFAKDLASSLGVDDLNKLPLEFDLAWYDQKAVAITLTLMFLGIKNIKIGPTLPEFLAQHIINKFKDRISVTSPVD